MELAEAYDQQKKELQSNVEQLNLMIKSYSDVLNMIDTLPLKLEHEVLVPLCGSTQVLARGLVKYTNQYISQLGETTYVARTAHNTRGSLESRLKMAMTMKGDFTKQIGELESRQGLAASELSTKRVDEDDRIETLSGAPNENSQAPGLIRKTPEGFLEIIETLPPVDAPADTSVTQRSNVNKNSMPLIQEVSSDDHTVAQPKPKAKARAKRSKFAEEFMK